VIIEFAELKRSEHRNQPVLTGTRAQEYGELLLQTGVAPDRRKVVDAIPHLIVPSAPHSHVIGDRVVRPPGIAERERQPAALELLGAGIPGARV
jgi:hypothetical protein